MTRGGAKSGLGGVADMMASAEVVSLHGSDQAKREHGDRQHRDADRGHDDGNRERDIHPSERLPDDCPVIPLGTIGGVYFYLDELNQLREVKAKEHEKGTIESLFGRKPRLCDLIWPRYGAKKDPETGEPVITGWRPEQAARALRAACARRGVWSPSGKARGAGAHRGEAGELILHCGDMVWLGEAGRARDGEWAKPGLIGDLVFPAFDRTPRPAVEYASTDAGHKLLGLLGTWNWVRGSQGPGDPGVDAMLLLGWIAGAMVCGALEWRPAAWITGGRGTGKSTLQKLIKLLLRDGLVEAANVTEAWVRQTLKLRTLPIAIDELEADEDGRRVKAIVDLARLASSGARMGRGSADHSAQDFTMKSSFLFSSILVPPLTPADRSRLAMLELEPLRGDAAPKLDPDEIGRLGRAVLRRMVDQWERLDETIGMYKEWLAGAGHDARMQDQFGTLLGCADCLLYDDLPIPDQLAAWARRLDAASLAEKAEDESEGELCAHFLATSQLQAVGGAEPEPMSMWIERALGRPRAGKTDMEAESWAPGAQRRLEMNGLRLVWSWLTEDGTRKVKQYAAGNRAPPGPVYVAVANSHEGLARLLRDTRWKGGVWQQALARLDGAVKRGTGKPPWSTKVTIAGRPEWATLVPISAFVTMDRSEDDA